MQYQLDWLLVILIDNTVSVAIEWSHFMLRTGSTSIIESSTRVGGDNHTTENNDKTTQFCHAAVNTSKILVKSGFVVCKLDIIRNSLAATARIDKNLSIIQNKCAVQVNATAIFRQKNPTNRTEASRPTTDTTSGRKGTLSLKTNRGSLNSASSETNRNGKIGVCSSGNEVITVGNGIIFTDEDASNMNIKFDLILDVIGDTPSTMTSIATTCDCVDINRYYYPPPIASPAACPTTLNFIISRIGLREYLVLKSVFDIFYGANNICECKRGFHENFHNNRYYYPTPFTAHLQNQLILMEHVLKYLEIMF